MACDPRILSGAAVGAIPMERRKHPRYHFTAAVAAVDTKARTHMNARTSDLGRGGCYVDAFCPFPMNTPVKMRLTREKQSFIANAMVTNSRIGVGMGLKFTDIDSGQLPVLEKWLGELSGETPCEPECTPEESLNEIVRSKGQEKVPLEQWYVLHELIITLMRKGALSHEEGKGMLRKLLDVDGKDRPQTPTVGATIAR